MQKEVLIKYVGTYLDPNGRSLTITLEDTTLTITGKGMPILIMYPEDENRFFFTDFDAQIQFTDCDTFILISNGKEEFTAKRKK